MYNKLWKPFVLNVLSELYGYEIMVKSYINITFIKT